MLNAPCVPVTLVIPRLTPMTLLVLKGTTLSGWNLASFEAEDVPFLMENFPSSIGLLVDENDEVDAEDWVCEDLLLVRVYELPEVGPDGRISLFFCFDGNDCEYVNPADDPNNW